MTRQGGEREMADICRIDTATIVAMRKKLVAAIAETDIFAIDVLGAMRR